MRRLICILSILCLLLTACGGAPAETTLPAETMLPTEMTLPPETTAPAVDNDMSYDDQDLPIPEDPAETTATPPIIVRIDDPETMIYAAPGFVNEVTALVEEAGIYTIVEEATMV